MIRRVLLIALVMLSLAAGFPEVDLKLRNVQFLPSPVSPGSEVTLQATLVHEGTLSYKNVVLEPVYVSPLQPVTEKVVIPRMDPGQRFPVTIKFRVADGTPSSVYPLDIKVSDTNIEYGDYAEKTITVSVPVSSTPLLSLSGAEQHNVRPGSEFVLAFNVSNKGGLHTGKMTVSLSFQADPGFMFYTSNPLLDEGVPAGSWKKIEFRGRLSPNAVPGAYEGVLKISCSGGEFSFPVYVLVEGHKQLEIMNVSSGLTVGSEGSVCFSFRNPLGIRITGVRVRISSDALPLSMQDPEVYYDSLSPGEEKRACYRAFVDRSVPPGSYPVTVSLSSDQVSKTASVDVLVKGVPRLSLSSVSYDVDRIVQGAPLLLSVQLENTGTGDARNVRITISGPQGQSEQRIGTIEPDDTGTGVFDARFPDTGKEWVTVTAYYEDDYGTQYQQSFKAQVLVNPRPADYTPFIAAASAAAVFLAYLGRKRKRKKWLRKVF